MKKKAFILMYCIDCDKSHQRITLFDALVIGLIPKGTLCITLENYTLQVST